MADDSQAGLLLDNRRQHVAASAAETQNACGGERFMVCDQVLPGEAGRERPLEASVSQPSDESEVLGDGRATDVTIFGNGNGIPAVVASEGAGGMYPVNVGFGTGRVLVSRRDAERAKELIYEAERGDFALAEDELPE